MTFMLDCSHYQGAINWAQVKADGCVGAYVKTTDGATALDAQWQTNHAGARANGVPVGPYHFAEGGDAGSEAGNFGRTWTAGWDLDPVLDYEIASANAAWLKSFRSAFRAQTGFQPFRAYSSLSLFQGALNPVNWIDTDTTLWVAAYRAVLGWNHPAAVLWQNTDAATVPGIVGNVDEEQFLNGWTPATDQGGTVTTPQDFLNAPVYTRTGTVAPGPRSVGAILQFLDQVMLDGGPDGVTPDGASIVTALGDLRAAVTADQAIDNNVLAAIKGFQAGQVDVNALAAALVPVLSAADAKNTIADVAAALTAASQ